MPTNTTLTVHAGRTVLLFASGKASQLLVSEGDSTEDRLKKLKVLDDLYDRWVQSTYDKTKSPIFKNGRPHGFIDAYTGSLFFVEEDDPQIVLVHVFEDHLENEYNEETLGYTPRQKQSGINAAKDYKAAQFGEKGDMGAYFDQLGITECTVWYARYKNGHTYP